LGDVIRDRRKLSRLSLRELAARTNVSNAYLSQIERGLHQPSIRVLRAIADALEMSSDQILAHAGLGRVREDDPESTPTDTEVAIRQDPRLSQQDRETLLALYRRLVDRG
jgi:transcriptional regulator with XRE-family HTH domain